MSVQNADQTGENAPVAMISAWAYNPNLYALKMAKLLDIKSR